MDPASRQALDAFGKAVVHEVYDRSCKYLFDVISRGMRGNKPDPLHNGYQALDPVAASLLRKFMLEAVDQTFAQFLAFIENHQIAVPFSNGDVDSKDVASLSDGLAAEPYAEGGWISRFSAYKEGIPEPD
ncbi:hypothetical protein [Lignipirellula cremea]|uniref:Uncharacterized protein n=1 Tax=Lignipirellula cremea TaxID=2528010 RepID=A0A518E0N7_9BACT|nr:hypothetical protein [Lignipirellula cremea]QDU97655.1 hypothetical protein Pla8534_55060 [Lignipirellula cremea]